MKENRIIIYPVPEGADLDETNIVRIRSAGTDQWIRVPCYTVKIDMHDVRKAGMAYFDFEGSVEVEIETRLQEVYQVDIRPLNRNIKAEISKNRVGFTLDKPENLSVELNGDRFHNLHIFTGKPEKFKKNHKNNVIYMRGNLKKPSIHRIKDIVRELKQMPNNRTLYFEPGIHYFEECCMEVPSDTNIYIAGGAIIKGGFICENVKNIKIYGKGIVYQACYERFMGIRGVRISHGTNISIEGISFINPPHYTIYLGGSKDIHITNVKTFSCEGWSDGFDMMSCENVHIDGCFLRTSDDCIAIYGRRWDYNGASRNILVENTTLWADVAHPTMIGTHGDYEHDGNILEDIHFKNLDILEHHETQSGYLGCLAINVGDKNIARNISYEDIRIEPFEHGKVFDFQVKCNPDYNPAPGKEIENVLVRNVTYLGENPVPSCISGYGKDGQVRNIQFDNLVISGKKIEAVDEKQIIIGEYTENINFQ